MQKGILVKVGSIFLLSKCDIRIRRSSCMIRLCCTKGTMTHGESGAHKETIYYGKMKIELI